MDEGPESHNNWPVDKKLNATKQTPSSRLSEMRSQLLASPGRSESCCSTLRLQLNISEQLVREVNMFLQKPPFESRPSDELQDTASDWANEDCGGDQGCRNKWEALELVREARATGSKVKASNLYVESLRIGGWQVRISADEIDSLLFLDVNMSTC